jgi:hypothetical protein
VVVSASVGFAAADHYGQVTVGGLAVPGATVTASQGEKQVITTTDPQGVYKLAGLADGVWTLRIEMLGFSTISQDVTLAPDSPPSMWELKLRPFEEIARDMPPRAVEPAQTATAGRLGPDNAGRDRLPTDTTAGNAGSRTIGKRRLQEERLAGRLAAGRWRQIRRAKATDARA